MDPTKVGLLGLGVSVADPAEGRGGTLLTSSKTLRSMSVLLAAISSSVAHPAKAHVLMSRWILRRRLAA